ncbi:hypothetical protein CONLIGDRAFT_45305 [Coniochaeta ligniaria NRRL 30616]|uniref:Uncharacterized protein n=1 Tax=Coniochaeta ligniaria NRRL 30616 TaxID=1408157 RepID=A0A1J7K4P1_9PEZI|nr:hypothetical protein CONLIGDRAFT_45305 [Coniochaeta ligniaria NRRL 30616]
MVFCLFTGSGGQASDEAPVAVGERRSLSICAYHFQSAAYRRLAGGLYIEADRKSSIDAQDPKVRRCRHPLTGVCTRMAACWYRAWPRLQRFAWATRRVRDVAEPVTRSRHQRRDAGQNMRLELGGRGSLHLHEPALLRRNNAPNATLWWQAKDHAGRNFAVSMWFWRFEEGKLHTTHENSSHGPHIVVRCSERRRSSSMAKQKCKDHGRPAE